MKRIFTAFLPLVIIFASCKKSEVINPESSKELKIINWDSSKFGGYVNCGSAGLVDGAGLYYQFIAPSEQGEITITNFVYHINVNDGSKPFTMISMYDGYGGPQKDILVNGSDIEFSNMRCVVPEGDNGRYYGASLTYSGIGRNGVVSGRTVSSVTLVSLTYVDRNGYKKTIQPNLKSPNRMSAFSYLWLNPQYYQNSMNGLSVGQNMIFQQALTSVGGDHLLKEIPLNIRTTDCTMGIIPQISVSLYDGGNTNWPLPIIPTNVIRINDSLVVIKLLQPFLVKKGNMANITFYSQVQSISNISTARLKTSLGNLKHLKYIEVATNTEFLLQNEQFMWMQYYYSPYNILDYYLELYP